MNVAERAQKRHRHINIRKQKSDSKCSDSCSLFCDLSGVNRSSYGSISSRALSINVRSRVVFTITEAPSRASLAPG
jgi:hypothetical protein